tara:strand:- start:2902 stop:3471 length:570 start_codon:yes stop_codon:yes gene_type:complete
MRRSYEDESAEVGTSAMIIFIALILVSSIISAIIVGVGQNVFTLSQNDAEQNIPSAKGITNVVVLEVFSLGPPDEVHIVFELPYIEQPLFDEDLSWNILCVPSNQGVRDTIRIDSGNFELATTLDGDGETALPLVEFEPGAYYRMIMVLDDCDLTDVETATLVIMVDRGRTQELQMNIGSSPYEGQDLN